MGNLADLEAAHSMITRFDWTVDPNTANTESAVQKWIEAPLAQMNLDNASYSVSLTGFQAAGVERKGSFSFTVALRKGEGAALATDTITIQSGVIAAIPASPSFAITAVANVGGSISPEGTTQVAQSGKQAYHIIPDKDYMVAEVLVDGVSVKKQLIANTYTFNDVQQAHTIEVRFEKGSLISPQTGDPSIGVWWLMLLMLLAYATIYVRIIKKSH